MMEYLRDLISKAQSGEKYGRSSYKLKSTSFITYLLLTLGTCDSVAGNYTLQFADDFSYTDPVSYSGQHLAPSLMTALSNNKNKIKIHL